MIRYILILLPVLGQPFPQADLPVELKSSVSFRDEGMNVSLEAKLSLPDKTVLHLEMVRWDYHQSDENYGLNQKSLFSTLVPLKHGKFMTNHSLRKSDCRPGRYALVVSLREGDQYPEINKLFGANFKPSRSAKILTLQSLPRISQYMGEGAKHFSGIMDRYSPMLDSLGKMLETPGQDEKSHPDLKKKLLEIEAFSAESQKLLGETPYSSTTALLVSLMDNTVKVYVNEGAYKRELKDDDQTSSQPQVKQGQNSLTNPRSKITSKQEFDAETVTKLSAISAHYNQERLMLVRGCLVQLAEDMIRTYGEVAKDKSKIWNELYKYFSDSLTQIKSVHRQFSQDGFAGGYLEYMGRDIPPFGKLEGVFTKTEQLLTLCSKDIANQASSKEKESLKAVIDWFKAVLSEKQ